jgi:glycosyltransferase involved in cell wall biosynthesis
MQGPAVLAIYIEPAPYIVSFIEEIRALWPAPVEVGYIDAAHTQAWGYRPNGSDDFMLPRGLAGATTELWRRMRTGRYGLVHLAGWGHPVLLLALLIAKANGMLVTMESDTPLMRRPFRWKSLVKLIAYPWLFALVSAFLPGGSRQAAYLRRYAVDDRRIYVAQMTVDVDRIRHQVSAEPKTEARKRFDIAETETCILYVGRLEPYKGTGDLLEAFRLVSLQTFGVSLLVVGDGSMRFAVENEMRACERLRYPGRLSGNELWSAYKAADMLVLPSHSESWGLVVNEAMAAGLPVIVTDRVGCADDLVHEGITGLIVPADAPAQLAAAIVRLCEDPELRGSLGRNGAELISTWTLHEQAERTIDAWRAALRMRAQF